MGITAISCNGLQKGWYAGGTQEYKNRILDI